MVALVLAGAMSGACEQTPSAPTIAGLDVALSFSVDAPLPSTAAAFDLADRMTIDVTTDDGQTASRNCDIPAAQEEISCEITDLGFGQGVRNATVLAQLWLGSSPVFTGSGDVELTPGEVTPVEIELGPLAAVTSVSPARVELGRTVTLEVAGANLHGAAGISVCGGAAVGPASVNDDGTRMTADVIWPAYNPGSQATPECSVTAHTPLGQPFGTIETVLVAPPEALTLITHNPGDGWYVALWDPTGGTLANLAGPFNGADFPRFAPGGGSATFSVSADGTPATLDIFAIDLASGSVSPLVATSALDEHFAWLSAGSVGVFRRCQDGVGCWLWDWVGGTETNRGVDGCNPITPELGEGGELFYSSSWDPVNGCSGGGRIQRWSSPEPISLAGGDPCCGAYHPRVSPNGDQIAYIYQNLSGHAALYTMASDGSNQTLRFDGGIGASLAWAGTEWIANAAGGLFGIDLSTGLRYWLLAGNVNGVDRQ